MTISLKKQREHTLSSSLTDSLFHLSTLYKPSPLYPSMSSNGFTWSSCGHDQSAQWTCKRYYFGNNDVVPFRKLVCFPWGFKSLMQERRVWGLERHLMHLFNARNLRECLIRYHFWSVFNDRWIVDHKLCKENNKKIRNVESISLNRSSLKVWNISVLHFMPFCSFFGLICRTRKYNF